MIRITLAAILLATPVYAAEKKEESCKYQGQVMAAVQAARLDRVKHAQAEQVILDSNPAWPAQYSKAIPQLVSHIYAMKRRDLKVTEFGPLLEQQCLENWDQIQAMQQQLKSN
ncbi:hypothetical protein PH5382_01888 [Phaeobacter sp. CECT 5382]|uniref:hypothetical protein n=1 Tax=Phaeobacter sp. CECT 5382 TaxID=1712645 RepID=UPI0006DB35AD|nr:hypothetical protein [Phaeobacter sp. CECT 5382]CUH87959.1 hypothetical protein PH5382_01888 [Phaeobacter sp. CECT 5382]